MFKKYFPMTLGLLIVSCSPIHNFDYSVQSRLNMEKTALNRTWSAIEKQCGYVPPEIAPRDKAMKDFECKERLYNEIYLPVVLAPDLLIKNIAKSRLVTEQYAKGQISKDTLKSKYQQLEAEYMQERQMRFAQARSQALQQQQIYTQQMNAFGQALQNQSAYETHGQCSSLSIAPMASLGCKNLCINGSWAEICG